MRVSHSQHDHICPSQREKRRGPRPASPRAAPDPRVPTRAKEKGCQGARGTSEDSLIWVIYSETISASKLSDLFQSKLPRKSVHPQHKRVDEDESRNPESPLGRTSDVHSTFLMKSVCTTRRFAPEKPTILH